MSQKIQAQAVRAYDTQFPDWYWKHGLHDAVILSVSQLQLAPDYQQSKPNYNCLEIALNCKNALFEKDIKKILFYNYRITGIGMDSKEPITPEALENVFWLHDSIAPLEDGCYLLEMECTDSRCNLITVSVKFETAEIVRK